MPKRKTPRKAKGKEHEATLTACSPPMRFDDCEYGRVNSPERKLLCALVRDERLLSVAELVEATGFGEDVIDDLLEGYRPITVAVWRSILRWATRLTDTNPGRHDDIVCPIARFMVGDGGAMVVGGNGALVSLPDGEVEAGVMTVHDPRSIVLPTARARWEHQLDWDAMLDALRSKKVVKLAVPPDEVDVLLRLVEETMTELSNFHPESIYDHQHGRLWMWDARTHLYEYVDPNGEPVSDGQIKAAG